MISDMYKLFMLTYFLHPSHFKKKQVLWIQLSMQMVDADDS